MLILRNFYLFVFLFINGVGTTETDDKFSVLTDARKKELLEAYSKSDVLIVHQKLAELRKKWMEKLKSKEAAGNQPLRRRLNSLMPKMLPQENGPTVLPIHEINRDANLSEFLYQADMVLTITQAEQLGKDNEGARAKRQAYRDIFYPNTIWGRTVFYFFDPSARKSYTYFLLFHKLVWSLCKHTLT
nr:metalloprotease III [Haemonchus contortus]